MKMKPWLILCILTASLMAGCSNTLSTGPMQQYDPVTLSLPYVEAVHIPSDIHAGQAFTMQMDISADANTNVLRDTTHSYLLAVNQFNSELDSQIVVIRPFLDPQYTSSGNSPASSISISVQGLAAGVHEIHYASAPAKAQGGMSVTVNKVTGWEMDDLSTMLKKQSFTVLP